MFRTIPYAILAAMLLCAGSIACYPGGTPLDHQRDATCAAFAGVALTPENAAWSLHLAFTAWAFRLFPVTTFFLAIAALRSPSADRAIVVAWFTLTALLAAFVVVITWGPAFSTPEGRAVQVLSQRVVAIAVVALVAFLSTRSRTSHRTDGALKCVSCCTKREVHAVS